jgi:hypothetical protein
MLPNKSTFPPPQKKTGITQLLVQAFHIDFQQSVRNGSYWKSIRSLIYTRHFCDHLRLQLGIPQTYFVNVARVEFKQNL